MFRARNKQSLEQRLACPGGRRRVAALGEDDPAVLRVRTGLANVLAEQGHAGAAETLCLAVEEAQIRCLGLDHPDTLKTQSNLAGLWARNGRLKEAEQLLRVVLSTQVQRLVCSPRLVSGTCASVFDI